MSHWPFWLGGLGLASVAIAHWLILDRLLAVSGRLSALIDRVRDRRVDDPELTPEQMLDALRSATAAEFGADAVGAAKEPSSPMPSLRRPVPTVHHVVFFVGLVLGGALVAAASGGLVPTGTLHGEGLARLSSAVSLPPSVLLLLGGLLVGFGTRMAGGCTSGHGLCGVSRLQPGSLLATCTFFGAGIGFSLLVEALW